MTAANETTRRARARHLFFSVAGVEVFAEWNGCTRGRTWFDTDSSAGERAYWFGQLHVSVSRRECAA
jgi:hypothetical protein